MDGREGHYSGDFCNSSGKKGYSSEVGQWSWRQGYVLELGGGNGREEEEEQESHLSFSLGCLVLLATSKVTLYIPRFNLIMRKRVWSFLYFKEISGGGVLWS